MFQPTGTIDDLEPAARRRVEQLFDEAARLGFELELLAAGRTCAEQNALHQAGITNASGCESWHVLGRAVDLMIHGGTCADYTRLGAYWESLGGFWGGRWTGYGPCGDQGHFHLPEPGAPAGVPPGCPPSPADCEAYRQSYLERAFSPRYGLLQAVALGSAIALGVVWYKRHT